MYAAFSQPNPTTPSDRSTEFVPVEGGSEGTSAEALLVTAYLVMWALLLGFVLLTWRRQRQIDARLERIEATLSRAAGDRSRAG